MSCGLNNMSLLTIKEIYIIVIMQGIIFVINKVQLTYNYAGTDAQIIILHIIF
jgi:hypothetical protein